MPSATTQIARDRILGRHPFWVTVLSMCRTQPKKIYVFEMRHPPRQLFLRLGILIDNSSLSAIRRSLWFCDWHIIEVPKLLPVSLSWIPGGLSGRAQRSGPGRVLKKSRAAGESGRSVEIFNQVFPATLSTLRYFRNLGILVYQKCQVYPKYRVIQRLGIEKNVG